MLAYVTFLPFGMPVLLLKTIALFSVTSLTRCDNLQSSLDRDSPHVFVSSFNKESIDFFLPLWSNISLVLAICCNINCLAARRL